MMTSPAPTAQTAPQASEADIPTPRMVVGVPREDKLYFAQVREDARLELEALKPRSDGRYAIVSSGGCTALSLLARGAGHVAAIDQNRTQNHMVELKAAALRNLVGREVQVFLGARSATADQRETLYRKVRPALSRDARAYWDKRARAVGAGVLGSGVTERFLKVIVAAVRLFIHPQSRMDRLLECATVEEQVELYGKEWDNRRWKALFFLMLNRAVFNRTYHPAFFRKVENPGFSNHFRSLFDRTAKSLPTRSNYFLHYMIKGRYPADVPDGVPAYLDEAGMRVLAGARERLLLVDGTFTDYLRTLPDASLDGYSLSNILEWHTPEQMDALLIEVIRTARPGAVLCFRNFVGWTDIPGKFHRQLEIDPASEALIDKDRSLVQSRFVAVRIRP